MSVKQALQSGPWRLFALPAAIPGGSFLVLCLLLQVLFYSCKKTEISNPATEDIQTPAKKTGVKTNSLPGTDFMIVVMPDIQYETGNKNGATPAMLKSQINWIKAHKVDSNIVYVIGLGDISDDGDDPARTDEWVTAKNNYYALDTAGIPYGLAVGNHDQYPNQGFSITDATNQYNTYFGVSHFTGKPYYGGHYTGGSGANDSHYDLFSAGGKDWIVIYLEYDSQNQDRTNMNTWAYNLLGTYASRKAIIVTHYFIDNSASGNTWGSTGGVNPTNSQGQGIYDKLKTRPNVCMFLCGHVGNEGYRQDTYNGKTIKTILADYQFTTNGGNGYMRLMHFSVDKDRVGIQTYSPVTGTFGYSQFTKTLFREPTTTRTNDFENDGKSNLAFFNAGVWKASGLSNVTQGASGDIPCPGDYDGDGKTDYVYWHPADGTWHNMPGGTTVSYGTSGDIPVPADYNGDGKTDVAVYRPGATGTWYRLGAGVSRGSTGDIPIPADVNGDGFVDEVLYTPSTKTFSFWDHVTGTKTSWTYGITGDIPVLGDYDGDGIIETVIYRTSTGEWFNHHTGAHPVWGGQPGDIPAPGDYLGNGTTQMAYYRAGVLYINGGSTITLGSSGDKILNLPYPVRNYFFP